MQNIHAGKNEPMTSMEGALEHPLQPNVVRHSNQAFVNPRMCIILFHPYGVLG
jgi:hypothetical protein